MSHSNLGEKSSNNVGTFHSKNDQIIMVTPPSPANSPPALAQSTSDSTCASTSSPPLPITPARSIRSHSRSRYPGLGHGHVPLHRRGTSKTYERLEDLLREAGYKETRIFTPEVEHVQPRSTNKDSESYSQKSGVRNGMGAFVNFLTGLMPNPTANRSTTSLEVNSEERDRYSPPTSPLSRKRVQKEKHRQQPQTPSPMSSSVESLEPIPRSARLGNTSRLDTLPEHQVILDQSSFLSRRSPIQSSQRSLHQNSSKYLLPNDASSQDTAHRQHASRASVYLRHIASAPNMAKRPSLTSTSSSQSYKSLTGQGDSTSRRRKENREHGEPPLPGTWLGSVARAVLFGGVGAYIGGPSNDAVGPTSQTQHLSPHKTLRSTRSSITSTERRAKHPPSRSAFSDRGNTKRSPDGPLLGAPPPELFSQLQRGRSSTTVSKVSQTHVTCRSAPASRASSVVRGNSNEGKKEKKKWDSQPRNGKEREYAQWGREGRGRHQRRAVDRDRLPSLADTQAEGDEWVIATKRTWEKKGHGRSGRLTIEVGGDEHETDGENEDHPISSSDEEDSELDLARILVNPKRQNSIKSLRKHLATPSPTEATVSSKLMKATGVRPTLGRSKSMTQRQSHTVDPHFLDGGGAENWGGGSVRYSSRRNSGDEDDDDTAVTGLIGQWSERPRRGGVFGSGRSATSRNIPRIPGPWSFIVGGGS